MVTEIDQLFNAALERAETGRLLLRDDAALRPDRQAGAASLAVGIDCQRLDLVAGIEGHSGNPLGQRINGTGERVVLADELRDEGILRLFIQRHRRVELLDHAVIEHGDAVRHGQRLGLVVRHIDDGHAQIFVDMLDFILHMLAKLLVERAERLVHQNQLGLEHQRAR